MNAPKHSHYSDYLLKLTKKRKPNHPQPFKWRDWSQCLVENSSQYNKPSGEGLRDSNRSSLTERCLKAEKSKWTEEAQLKKKNNSEKWD